MMMQSGLELNYTASHAERYMGLLVQNVDGVDRFLSVSMPLNLGYCIGCVGGSIDPYAGVDVRLNMVGKSRVDGFECVDYFDDLNAKRFQLGLNAGVDVNFVIFYLGYRFTKDMTDFIPGMYSRISCHKFVMGLNFFNYLFCKDSILCPNGGEQPPLCEVPVTSAVLCVYLARWRWCCRCLRCQPCWKNVLLRGTICCKAPNGWPRSR